MLILYKGIFRGIVLEFYKILARLKGIQIDSHSSISISALKKNLINHDKDKKKIIIKRSELGNVILGEGSKLNGVVCNGNIQIGRFVSINGPATRISAHKNKIEIGDFTSIASNVVIQEHSHNKDRLTSYYIFSNLFRSKSQDEIVSKGSIKIEEDVWIGSNVTILSGVKIGRGSVIGAGSVVTKNVPRYSIVVGNPAKKISMRFNEEVIDKIEKSRWWNKNVSELEKMKEIFELNLLDEEDIQLFFKTQKI